MLLGVEQNKPLFFRFPVTSHLLQPQIRAQAACGYSTGGTGTRLVQRSSDRRRGCLPLSLAFVFFVIYSCSNISCPNEGASFNPGPSPGLSIKRGRFCN